MPKRPPPRGVSKRQHACFKRFTVLLSFMMVFSALFTIGINTKLVRSLLKSFAAADILPASHLAIDKQLLFQLHDKEFPGEEKLEKEETYVSYTIFRNQTYNLTFALGTRCPLGKTTNKWGRNPQWREPLDPGLQPSLNVTTRVRTNLRILVLGDSVGIQFGEILEEALGNDPVSRVMIHQSWAGNEGVTLSANSESGGVVALYRITGMLLAPGEGKPLPNAPGGGWNRTHVHQLLHHLHMARPKSSDNNVFDVMIFRIPHGWLRFDEITEKTIKESLQLARSLFGVHKFILINIPFSNNIETARDLQDRLEVNSLIRQVADSYDAAKTDDTYTTQVTVLDFARWTDQLMEYNARSIGKISDMEMMGKNRSFALDRLGCRKYPLSIAQGCAMLVQPGECNCQRNRVSHDGMHWCLESIGGRFVAGIACLLSCLVSYQPQHFSFQQLRTCEQQCNARFMSMQRLDFMNGVLHNMQSSVS